MDKQKAVQKLATAGRLSIAHAEDLYDSIFPKPVVPQYVADWYEGNKDDFEITLFQRIGELVECYNKFSSSKFEDWLMDDDSEALTILVNMHQFGYEVEEETSYMVRFNNFKPLSTYLKKDLSDQRYYLGDNLADPSIMLTFTRKELEANGFGWVFSCEGIEIEEVK